MARRRKKKKKVVGQYGEVVLPDIKGAIKAIANRYRQNLPSMTILLNFNALGKNFIFQRLHSYPIDTMKHIAISNSVLFTAEWSADGANQYKLPKSFFETENKKGSRRTEWGDVSSFYPSKDISISSYIWTDSMDVQSEIRIDSIKSINMYGWGFEVIGDILSMIAIKGDSVISHSLRDVSMDTVNLSFKYRDMVADNNELIVRWSEPGYEPIKEAVDDFDTILFGGKDKDDKKKIDKIKNIGQRSLDNIILE